MSLNKYSIVKYMINHDLSLMDKRPKLVKILKQLGGNNNKFDIEYKNYKYTFYQSTLDDDKNTYFLYSIDKDENICNYCI